MKNERDIPAQETGTASNTGYAIDLHDTKIAQQVFLYARDNLLQVNKWHDLAGDSTAEFQLTDHMGNPVQRGVQQGDYFKISIPGPSNVTNDYDWVRVDAIEEQLKHNFFVWTMITVHPAPSPLGDSNATAHFFSKEASSTFKVERKGTVVKACVAGRNEKVNEQSQGWLDTMRNTIVAFTAMLGFNKPQWKNLVKGIIIDSAAHAAQDKKIA